MMVVARRPFYLISVAVAISLMATGFFVTTGHLLQFIRSSEPIADGLWDQLLLGATIFRLCLIVLGLLLIAIPLLPIWRASPNSVKENSGQERPQIILFAIIFGVALLLRVYDLNAGLWHDEISTYVDYVKVMSIGDIASTYISENQHFLFNVFARGAVLLFGDAFWTLRLPAMLFGVASIWSIYLLGREVTSEREALIAAALCTVSYHHIWFSQNARGYTGLLLWTILSSWFLLRAMRNGPPINWLWFAITVALGMYTHVTMLFAVAGQFLLYLYHQVRATQTQRKQGWWGFFLGFCLSGFLTVLLYSLALPQFLSTINETSTVAAWKNPLWTILEIGQGIQLSFGSSSFVLLPALLVFGVGCWSYLRSRYEIFWLLMLPAAICTGLITALGHHLWPRFYFFLMAFGVLIAVRGAVVLGTWAASILRFDDTKVVWAGTALAASMVVASTLSVPFVYGPKQDFESALIFIEEQRTENEAVAVVGLAAYTFKFLYQSNWVEVESLSELNDIRSKNDRSWLVYTFPPEVEAVYPDIMESIEHDFELVKRFSGTVNNGSIYVVRADDQPRQAQNK